MLAGGLETGGKGPFFHLKDGGGRSRTLKPVRQATRGTQWEEVKSRNSFLIFRKCRVVQVWGRNGDELWI